MDFHLDETQQDLRRLTAEILAKDGDSKDGSGDSKDAAGERLWQAGVMTVCVPEEAGGAGLGPVAMAVVLREVGARAAPVAALPVLVGTLALARHGTPGQQRHVSRCTVALREPGRAPAEPPLTSARPAGDGWALTGRKVSVPYPGSPVLITADEGLFLVESPHPGVPEFTSTGEPAATMVFDGTLAERVAGPEAVADVRRLFAAAVAAQASGVLAGALELTTAYVRTRKQFGRPLAEFQAVTMQVADVYIAGRALDVAMWSAAWRLEEGPAAEQDVALAAYHVSEAFKALYTCQHLHGGLGLDVTYPLHRYFAQAKHLSHLLGGADAQLDLIGALV
ncbi:acyl-CoA/acyl-ACP dehydrogenase [Nonomuraea sp. K274]|uniref:Acyl-CoA/acyl-ACP dehydrogenase n=1 Tax=Nonomuraea cypriaca TaxID=1187855 RepID=A0A931A7Q4_9ACTN|nr:acyl-CoA dehydrogenase family protein [Nonomuraea cypriaca]MBF8186718.1 acyl-CoA/acyl-ACP dehydrogenase [Nonomuraea cypriaca]